MEKKNKEGVGCGVFLVLIGAGLIAQRMGWITFDSSWLVPGLLILLGLTQIVNALR